MPVKLIQYYKGSTMVRKDLNHIGAPGERCADCRKWKKVKQEFNGPGEGQCKLMKAGELVWGGALCADFDKAFKA